MRLKQYTNSLFIGLVLCLLNNLNKMFMTKIMIRVIVIAIILMLFGFNNAASSLLGGMLSVVKWIFIIGGIGFILLLIFEKNK